MKENSINSVARNLNDGGSFDFTIDHLSPFLYSLDIESGKLQMFIIANQVKFYGG